MPTTPPHAWLFGKGGWHSWKVALFHAWLRAGWRAMAFSAITFEEARVLQFQNTSIGR